MPVQKIKGIDKNKAKGAFYFQTIYPRQSQIKIGNQTHIHLKLRAKEFFILNDQGNYMLDDTDKMAQKQEALKKAESKSGKKYRFKRRQRQQGDGWDK